MSHLPAIVMVLSLFGGAIWIVRDHPRLARAALVDRWYERHVLPFMLARGDPLIGPPPAIDRPKLVA